MFLSYSSAGLLWGLRLYTLLVQLFIYILIDRNSPPHHFGCIETWLDDQNSSLTMGLLSKISPISPKIVGSNHVLRTNLASYAHIWL